MKEEFNTIRDYVMVDRKPFDTEDLVTNDYNSLPKETKQLLKELPVLEYKPDFTEQGFFEYFLDGKVQFYLLKFDGRTFFIDTQGYGYARYVGEILNMETPQEDLNKIKIEIEFPEFVTKILTQCDYTPEQHVKILTAFVEGRLGFHYYTSLQDELLQFIDDIVDSGEEEDILNS